MDFNTLAIFTPVYSLDFEIEFLNYQGKIVSFYILSSRNIVHLKVEIKLDFSLCLEIIETVRVYYKLILYKELDTFDKLVSHLEFRASADEKLCLAPYFLKVLYYWILTHLLP